MICYPLGMMFALFKDEIEHFTSKHWGYAICLFVGIALFILSYACPFMDDPQQIYWEGCGWIWWNIRIISMIAIIVLLMMNLKIGNSFLIWMGVNLFPLYIYQRIPMIIISTYFTCNPFILFTASFALTCALVPLYKKIQIQL